MASIQTPAMATSPKFIFFTDFDGTITQSDSNDFLTDTIGFGQTKRKQGNQDVLNDRQTFRDSFKGMMDSVTTPYNECKEILLKNIKLDPGFKEFYEWAKSVNMPVVVLSSGMQPFIHALLQHLVGKEADDIQIISNDVRVREGKSSIDEEGGWEITFHDESHFGHDKSLAIRPYRALPDSERPTMFYAGDGVSDFSAATETDLLFAKRGHDLVTYCVREKMPFTLFDDWTKISTTVKDVIAGKTTIEEVSAQGIEEYKSDVKADEKTTAK